jgi:hypothetical protein
MLAYITGTVDQELLLRNEYLAAEDRTLELKLKVSYCSLTPIRRRSRRLRTGWAARRWRE